MLHDRLYFLTHRLRASAERRLRRQYSLGVGGHINPGDLGGTGDPAVLNERDDAVTEAVLEELHRIVGFTARASFVRIFRWPRSMAQYAVGHQERMAQVKVA